MSLVSNPKLDGMVPFKFPVRYRSVSLVSDPKLDGMVPFKLSPKFSSMSSVSDPKLDGMVPFKLLCMRSILVMSPFAHVTQETPEKGLHFLPPHAQGSSLSVLHCFQLFESPGTL
jgi:hypothetical protein